MPSFSHFISGSQWDFSLLAVLVLGLHLLLHRLVLKRLTTIMVQYCCVAVAIGFLVVSWFLIERAGAREKERVQLSMEGMAPTYALEMERMGHEKLTVNTPQSDPRYASMQQAIGRWLKANPNVHDVYTFRRLKDGGTVLIVEAPRAAGSEGRGGIGSPFVADEALLGQALMGSVALSAKPERTARGAWISAYYPLRDPSGHVEAFLGVEFDAQELLLSVGKARFSVTSYLAAFVLALAVSGAAIGAWSLERENRQHELTAVAMEESQRKLQDIINSIDGVVWEWEPIGENYVFVSNHAVKLLGQSEEVWLSDSNFWKNRLRSEDFDRVLVQRKHAATQDAPYQCEYRMIGQDGKMIWVRERGGRVCEKGKPVLLRGVMTDVTLEKIADSDLEDLNKQLVETSRRAGMAEVASGVLHNVGNVLNSVNVSCTVLTDLLKQSRLPTLEKVAALLDEQAGDLAGFFARDPRASAVPPFLKELSRELVEENGATRRELQTLVENVAHIKHIVIMQQSYASIGGITESLDPADIIEDAIRLHETACTRSGIEVVRELEHVPPVLGDRNRVLQILVNLMGNAKHALGDCARPDKRLTLGLHLNGGNRVKICVADNGSGIAPENLPRIFSYGFTTKRDGHGFGLHSGAIAAREMGGSLTVQSAGLGQGAAFCLELPLVSKSTTYTPRLS